MIIARLSRVFTQIAPKKLRNSRALPIPEQTTKAWASVHFELLKRMSMAIL
jgi:hypothetical protein